MNDLKCKNAKPRDKAYKISDSHGLYLHVLPTGMRVWRWNYRFGGVALTMTLGRYPELSLTDARLERAAYDKIRRSGVDPREDRQQVQQSHADAEAATFKSVALRWHMQRQDRWAAIHASNIKAGLERDVFPQMGDTPVSKVTSKMVMAILEPIEARDAVDRAHRLRQHLSAIFQFAIALDLAEQDPAAKLKGALKPKIYGRQPALLTIEDARALLLAAEKEPGHPLTKLASRLLALTAVRSGSLRHAEPHEFELDTEAPIWRIPAAKMKLSKAEKQSEAFDFIVPLAPQAVQVVKLALELTRGGKYVFPNARFANKPMSENAVSVMYRRLPKFASRHVPHGWRSTFSTIMNDRAQVLERAGDRAIIDLMLAHKPVGVEAIYNRASFMPRRRQIAEEWAELLVGQLPPAASLLEGPRR
jgi:integrase